MSKDTGSTIDPAGGRSPTFDFVSRHQRRLHMALNEYDESLADMYRGGIQVLHDETNPDRFAQAAHSFRELMEKAPRFIAVPEKTKQKRSGYNLKAAVIEVRRLWTSTKERTENCSADGSWNGQIDENLRRFLVNLEQFFVDAEAQRPGASDEFVQMHRRLDPSGVPLSERFEREIAAQWKQINGFFQSVSHHGSETSNGELQDYIDRLEDVLGSLLIPQTFEDYSALDQLIDEIEGR